MRRIITLISVTALLFSGGAASAKPRPSQPPSVSVSAIDCSTPNEIKFTASVTPDAELNDFFLQATRWEDLDAPPGPRWDRFDEVEIWTAYWPNARKGTRPLTHTLDTADPLSWEHRFEVDPAYYVESSDVFVLTVIAATSQWSRSGDETQRAFGVWVVDCAISPHTVTEFRYPYDVPRTTEYGKLNL